MNAVSSFNVLLGQQALKEMLFGKPASTQAEANDNMFMYIGWVSVVSFVLIMVAMVYFVVRFRRRPGVPAIRSASHNTPMELAWSIIPLLLMVPMFFFGMTGYLDKQAAPGNAEEIRVTGQQWNWSIEYSNGGAPKELKLLGNEPSPVIVVPANTPVKFIFTSKDVIHAFFVPDFRTKIDVIPNRYTSMWFNAIEPTAMRVVDGKEEWEDHRVFCAEYCGKNHSEMAAYIRVLTPDQYKLWKTKLNEVDNTKPPHERGQFYYRRFGCSSCHTTDGGKSTGPTWKGLWGTPSIQFEDGGSVSIETTEAFMNYVQESIWTPARHVHKGYPNQMPVFQGVVKPEQISDIVAYMQTIGSKPGPAESGGAGGPEGAGGAAGGATPAEGAKPEASPPAAPEKPAGH